MFYNPKDIEAPVIGSEKILLINAVGHTFKSCLGELKIEKVNVPDKTSRLGHAESYSYIVRGHESTSTTYVMAITHGQVVLFDFMTDKAYSFECHKFSKDLTKEHNLDKGFYAIPTTHIKRYGLIKGEPLQQGDSYATGTTKLIQVKIGEITDKYIIYQPSISEFPVIGKPDNLCFRKMLQGNMRPVYIAPEDEKLFFKTV
ncbi:hypothetical protein KNT64_gp223 [Pseudomonas phage PspYZU05]|uniref:Uncharacterized protein n=1 Tax=Pseudomonas phage PspYZU05 TaxID=1983556 RepID=A0A2U7N2U3_9CAUD|nr:hypothetical protein KNT64_gp223 [Pseudomonas phage PspYZU05]ASD52175.1 hypothetical protein PspYZU05_223 [Pseudomonas phage PspYZU05]